MTSVSSSNAAETSGKQPAPKLVRRILGVIGIVLLLIIAFWAVRTGIYAWQAYQSGQTLMEMARQSPSADDLPQAQAALDELTDATRGIERQLDPLTPLLTRMDFVPAIGGLAAASPALMRAGSDLTALGSHAVAILAPELSAQGSAPTLDGLLAAVTANGPELSALQDQASRAAAALAEVDVAQLPPALAGRLEAAQIAVGVLPTALQAAPELSTLLGFDAPMTYLLLVQNNHELRATGGFISAVGALTLDHGLPTNLAFSDSYDIFSEANEYGWAPEPMRRYMGIELLLLRDANWSPNFPSSAALASTLYTQDTGTAVDGVASIDLRAVQLLVEALGEINVRGTDQPITGANIVDQVKLFFDNPLEAEGVTGDAWWEQRKDFIPALADAALQRIESGNVNYAALMAKVLQALDEGAIQVWTKNPAAAATLAATGWDGGFHLQPSADFVFYTDTNMGYNKVDSVLERSLDYAVIWPETPGAPAQATVTMTYHHPIELPNHVCDPAPRYGNTYDDMAARCYFDYVRLFAPGGSRLLSATGLDEDSVLSERGEARTQRFSGYFVMEPGSTHTVTFTYELPPGITPENYRLIVQRQSGTGPLPVTLSAGADTLSTTVEANHLTWEPHKAQ